VTRALLDATVVIAAVDEDDEDHETGLEILQSVDRGELPKGIVVSDALQETLNFIHERQGHAAAVDVLDRFVRGAQFEIPYNPKKNYGEARSLFRSDGRLNFGDALQATYMQSESIEYIYSFDDDYDDVDGIKRLNAAVNPYS
jgi:predicted nucleic acid-binding protein